MTWVCFLFLPLHMYSKFILNLQSRVLNEWKSVLQAQLGVRHPLAGVEEGWAWVNIEKKGDESDGVAAHAMSDFVARTLAQSEAQGEEDAECSLEGANRTLPTVIKENPQLGTRSYRTLTC